MSNHIMLISEIDFRKIIEGKKTDFVYSFHREVKPMDTIRLRTYYSNPTDLTAPEIEAVVAKVSKVHTKTKGVFNYNLGLNIQLIMF